GWMEGLLINLGIAVKNAFITVMQVVEPIILSIVNLIIEGINKVLGLVNKISGKEIRLINPLESKFEGKDFKEFVNLTDYYNEGAQKGKDLYDSFSSKLDNITNFGGFDLDFSKFGTSQNPLNVTSKDKLK
ncbi:hypothetical protein, partial [Stenotrophomonas maltophilia group sp. RNC7]|uniref:hypothetical protein n=1 Tax=Stenotrophomonas maltophilia group sp. RNC7 TaxID=3071467 RepID=UPI0027E0A78D